jgi:hypothetical protein
MINQFGIIIGFSRSSSDRIGRLLNWMGSLLSIGDTDISEDDAGSFLLHTKIVATTNHGKMNIPGYVILLHKMLLTVLSVVPFRITPVKIHDTTNLLPYLTRQFPRNAILRLPRVIITSIRDKRLALFFSTLSL